MIFSSHRITIYFTTYKSMLTFALYLFCCKRTVFGFVIYRNVHTFFMSSLFTKPTDHCTYPQISQISILLSEFLSTTFAPHFLQSFIIFYRPCKISVYSKIVTVIALSRSFPTVFASTTARLECLETRYTSGQIHILSLGYSFSFHIHSLQYGTLFSIISSSCCFISGTSQHITAFFDIA